MISRTTAALAAILTLGSLPAGAAAQSQPAYFVLRIGNDTVAVEQYTRTATEISGRQLLRTPRTTIREYTATLDADGNATRFELGIFRPGEETPGSHAIIEFGVDTAHITVRSGDSTRVMRMAAPRGSIPFLGYSVGMYELPLSRHLRSGEARSESILLPIGSPTTYPLTIERGDAGWLAVGNIAGENRARVDREGRLLEWDGTGSTLKLAGQRLTTLDFDSLAASFVERERAGEMLGNLSPRDSVIARVGDAEVRIDYSRPSRRGRTIAGGVVPWDEIWRTGANQATRLSTSHDLMFGDTRVPAGEYSVWTLPRQDGWTLILNRQTGQWGTDYDAGQDHARIAMRSVPGEERPEQFTISFEPEGEAVHLVLSWGDVRVAVPVSPAS
jgi:hypothetical protein